MLLGLWVAKNDNQVRGVMVAGASALLIGAIWLTIYFVQQRAAGNTDTMLLANSAMWFKPLNIAFAVGVDGISVVMILLSAIIVFTGTFASWQLEPMKKEYFLWFVLLSSGVFGFFISTDMFTMFMFYEVALIPIVSSYWSLGNRCKRVFCHETHPYVNGWFRLTHLWFPWYLLLQWRFYNGRYRVSKDARNVENSAKYLLPICIHWLWHTRSVVPIPHMVARWTCFSPYGCVYAPRWCINEAGWL